jgi:hypothetical protein
VDDRGAAQSCSALTTSASHSLRQTARDSRPLCDSLSTDSICLVVWLARVHDDLVRRVRIPGCKSRLFGCSRTFANVREQRMMNSDIKTKAARVMVDG